MRQFKKIGVLRQISEAFFRIVKKHYLDVFLGVLFPFIIGYLLLHRILESSGFILYWDLLTEFGGYISLPGYIPENTLIQAPFKIYYWLGFPSDLAQRLVIIQNYVLAGVCMFVAIRFLFPKKKARSHYVASVTAAICYMINIPAITTIPTPWRMMSYSILPLITSLYIKALNSERNSLRNVFSVAVAITLSLAWPPMLLVSGIIFMLYQIYRLVLKLKGQDNIRLFSDFKKNLMILALFLLLNANWISNPFRFIFNPLLSESSESVIQPSFSSFPMRKPEVGDATLINRLTLNLRLEELPETLLSNPAMVLIPLVIAVTLIISIRRKKKFDRLVLFHGVLAALFVAVSTRSPPFGDLVYSLMKYTSLANSGLNVFWSRGHALVYAACYSYSFIAAALSQFTFNIIESKKRRRENGSIIIESKPSIVTVKITGNITFALIFLSIMTVGFVTSPWILSTSFPLDHGENNFLARFVPAEIPEEYLKIDSYLTQQKPDNVWWLPEPVFTMFEHTWNSHPFKGYWASTYSANSIENTLFIRDQNQRFATYLYLMEVLGGKSSKLSEVLSIGNVDYVIARLDAINPNRDLGKDQELADLMAFLERQENLSLVWNEGSIYAFKNQDYTPALFSPPRIGLVVGGLDLLTALAERIDMDLKDYCLIFSEQLKEKYLRTALSLTDTVFFSQQKDLEDLYLQFAQDHFLYPARYVTDSLNGFSVGSAGTRSIYMENNSRHFDQEGDFLYGSSSISSSTSNASINIPINIESKDDFELWLRIMKSPLGGELSIQIDETHINTINTKDFKAYLKWIKIGDINLDPKTHLLTIKNNDGFNLVNVALISPTSNLKKTRGEISGILEDKAVIAAKRSIIKEYIDQKSINSALETYTLYGKKVMVQLFIPQTNNMSKIILYKERVGSPENLTIELHPTKKDGTISQKTLAKTTIPPEATATGGGKIDTVELATEDLIPGERYWITIYQEDYGGDQKNSYHIHYIKDSYPNGSLAFSGDEGLSWYPSTKTSDQTAVDPNITPIQVYGNQVLAQSFTPQAGNITSIAIYKERSGSPENLTIELHPTKKDGAISPEILTKTTLPPEATALNGGRLDQIYLPAIDLIPGERYWITIYQEDYGGDQKNSYQINIIPNVYTKGHLMQSIDQGVNWTSNHQHDLFFKTFSSTLKPDYDLFFSTRFVAKESGYDLENSVGSEIILLFLNSTSNEVKEVQNLKLPSSNSPILEFISLSPETYKVTVNSPEPFVLVIPTTYNPNWVIEGADSIHHFPAYSFLNGYIIEKPGQSELLIYRTDQRLRNIGNSIGLISFLCILIITVFAEIKASKHKSET